MQMAPASSLDHAGLTNLLQKAPQRQIRHRVKKSE